MATHQVNHQYGILLKAIQHVIEPIEIHIVNTGFIFAKLIQLPLRHVGMRYAITCAFTAAIIFTPEDVNASMCQYVQQPFLMMR
ncbi:hypothetical protein D3C72_2327530 [compost metagenome]